MESSPTSLSSPTETAPAFSAGLIVALLKETAAGYSEHRIAKMAAALSYYTAFSLAPLIVLLLSLASLAVKKDVARQGIIDQATGLMGEKGGAAVADILQNGGTVEMASWGALVSVVVLLIGASGVFGEMQDSLNQIWEVTPPKRPFRQMAMERLLSFAMVFVMGFLMLTSLVVSAVIADVSQFFVGSYSAALMELANTAISFVVISALFAIIFRMLPEVEVKWREVWPGAIFSASLFILGKFLLGWYVGRGAVGSSYGAAGSFVVILFWVYYSSQIMFIGAQFTHCYTKHLRGKGKTKR